MKLIIGIPGLYNGWYRPEQAWDQPLPAPDYSDLDKLYKELLQNKPDWKLYRGLFNLSGRGASDANRT